MGCLENTKWWSSRIRFKRPK